MKKLEKHMSTLLLALAIVLSCAACGGGQESAGGGSGGASGGASDSGSGVSVEEFEGAEWTLAHNRTEDSRSAKAAEAFAKAVTEKTDGKIQITVYGNSSLGDYSVVQERVSLGDVTMQMADFSKAVDPSLVLPSVPYIISTWEEFEEYYHVGHEGAIMAEFAEERLALQNIKLLGCYPQYFGSICSAEAIENWQDPLAPKNQKARVPTEMPMEKTAETFGFLPVGMPSSEAYTAIQTGIVTGMFGGGTEYYWNQMKDIINYILPVNTHPNTYWLYINADALAAIPEEYQQLLYDLADEYLFESGLKDAIAEMTLYEEYFTEKGGTVYEVTEEIQKAYADACRENVWPLLANEDYLGESGLEIFHKFMDAYGIAY